MTGQSIKGVEETQRRVEQGLLPEAPLRSQVVTPQTLAARMASSQCHGEQGLQQERATWATMDACLKTSILPPFPMNPSVPSFSC